MRRLHTLTIWRPGLRTMSWLHKLTIWRPGATPDNVMAADIDDGAGRTKEAQVNGLGAFQKIWRLQTSKIAVREGIQLRGTSAEAAKHWDARLPPKIIG